MLMSLDFLGWEISFFFFYQAEDGIRDYKVTGVQTCALPISEARPDPLPQGLRLEDAEQRPVEWKRPAIAAGALVGVAVLIGALAGSQVGNGEASAQPELSVTAALPAPKPVAVAVSAPPAPFRSVEARPQRRPRAVTARIERVPARSRLASVEEQLSAGTPSGANPPEVNPAEDAAAPAVETAAALPLSNATVARTIERIGYACGEVASTSAGEAAGVYKVTCTSGQSYQAKPVRGRYHFRRLGSH